MEHICNDIDSISPWHYDAIEKAYYRCYKAGKHEGKIFGSKLPNPELLWKIRCDHIQKFLGKISPEDRERNKPGKVCYALWEDWQRRQGC